MVEITLFFRRIEIDESIGEIPKLRFRLNLQVGRLSQYSETRIQINRISFTIDLHSGRNPTTTLRIGNLGIFDSLESVSCLQNYNTIVEFSLPLNSLIIEKILEIRNSGNLVTFDIHATLSGVIFSDSLNMSQVLKIWQSQYHVFFNTPDGPINKIILPNERLQEILNQIHYTEILRIELPLYRDNTVVNQTLQSSIEFLKHASDSLKNGNNESAMIDIRKLLTNHLLIKNENDKRTLNETVKSELLHSVPTDIIQIYISFIQRLEEGLRAILQITNKFLHDNNTIKVPPLRKDTEYVYFTVAFIIKHIVDRICIS